MKPITKSICAILLLALMFSLFPAVPAFAAGQQGWANEGGDWYYYGSDGAPLRDTWQKSAGKWYYFGADGAMLTGWQEIGGARYHFAPGGAMDAACWIQEGGAWYYLDSSGAMLQSSWKKLGGKWYYFDESGAMVSGGAHTIDGKRYLFNADGSMVTGWKQLDGAWYYFSGSGLALTGWQKIGGTWYYMDESGVMQTGWLSEGAARYYLKSSGAMATGWLQDGENWYYFDASGRPCVGWKKINNRWFYFDGEGVMLTGVHYIDGYWYELSMFGGYNRSYSPPASHEYTEEEYAALYQPVLDRYRAFYRDLQEAYSSGNMYTYDVSECCRSSTSVGYTLLDLDGNDIQELLIGTTDYYMETNPILFDVYTISNGIISRVFISWGRNRHYLLDDMRIYNEGSSGAAYNSYVLYSLSGNNLSPIDGVQTTENPSAGPICRYRTTEFKMIQPEELRKSDEEAQALIDGWKSHIIVPQLTTFAYVGMS